MLMKTIYTTLPIYDKLAKQVYERVRKIATDGMFPIICPLTELPSFQWLDDGDGAASVSRIDLIGFDGTTEDITAYFTSLPLAHAITGDTYFVYNGGALVTPLTCGLYYLKITMNNAKIYYSEYFSVQDVYDLTTYSSKYLIFAFSNSSDIGNILYHTGFTQKLWLESEDMEMSFPIDEEGAKDGQGRFIRTFARQTKKYLARTVTQPDYIVEIFNRMRLHDTVTLTNLVGDVNTVYNIEVEHEWMSEDKYYAKLEITFDYDETFVVAGCGNGFI
jgi:hypothetical protein